MLCYYNAKITIDDMYENMRLWLGSKQAVGEMWPADHSFQIPNFNKLLALLLSSIGCLHV